MLSNLPFDISYDFKAAAELYMNVASHAKGNEKQVLSKAFELAIQKQFKVAAHLFESLGLEGGHDSLKPIGLFHAGLCRLLCGEICGAALAFKAAKKVNENDYNIYLFSGVAKHLLGLTGSANTDWIAASKVNPNDMIESILCSQMDHQNHPERLALFPVCQGSGLDVGCGSNKTHPDAIGVDLTPKERKGSAGCEKDKVSNADISASGDHLHMFEDQSFDYIVQRHNLEHYQDPIKALQEWYRLLKPGGILGMVVPDDRNCDTIRLDPTHKHVFTPSSLERILSLMGGFDIIHMAPLLYHWSFICVAQKKGANGAPSFNYLSVIAEFEKNQIMDKADYYLKNGLNQMAEECRRYAKLTRRDASEF